MLFCYQSFIAAYFFHRSYEQSETGQGKSDLWVILSWVVEKALFIGIQGVVEKAFIYWDSGMTVIGTTAVDSSFFTDISGLVFNIEK